MTVSPRRVHEFRRGAPLAAVVCLAVLLLGRQVDAGGIPVFFADIKGDRASGVDAVLLQQSGAFQPSPEALSTLTSSVVKQLDASGTFTNFTGGDGSHAELPDDLLLMWLAVDGADSFRVVNRVVSYDLPYLEVSIGLIDPRSGQVLYSSVELVTSLDDGLRGKIGKDGELRLDGRATGEERRAALAGAFGVLLDAAAHQATARMIREFQAQPLRAEVVAVIDRAGGLCAIDRGRIDGVFPGARMRGADGRLVTVESSSATVALCRTVGAGEAPAKGQALMGFQPLPSSRAGSAASPFLLGATRAILSSGARTAAPTLARDDDALNRVLAGDQNVDVRPIFQQFFASRMASALADRSGFTIAPTTGAIEPIRRAQARMNQALNIRKREGDAPILESFVIPDFCVASVLSSFWRNEAPLARGGNVQQGTRDVEMAVAGTAFAFDTRIGEPVGSGTAIAQTNLQEMVEGVTGSMGISNPDAVFAALCPQALARACRQCVGTLELGLVRADVKVSGTQASIVMPDGAIGAASRPYTLWYRYGTAKRADGSPVEVVLPAGTVRAGTGTAGGVVPVDVQLAADAPSLADLASMQPFVELPCDRSRTASSRRLGVVAKGAPLFADEDIAACMLGEFASRGWSNIAWPPAWSDALHRFNSRRFVSDRSFREEGSPEIGRVPTQADVVLSLDAGTLRCDEPKEAISGSVAATVVDASGKPVGKPFSLKVKPPASDADPMLGAARARRWLAEQARKIAEYAAKNNLGSPLRAPSDIKD